MDLFEQVAVKIIKAQENVIGPLAIEQAQKVGGLKFDIQKNEVSLPGDHKDSLEKLVENYKQLFGLASVHVCKDAARSLLTKLPKEQIPDGLL